MDPVSTDFSEISDVLEICFCLENITLTSQLMVQTAHSLIPALSSSDPSDLNAGWQKLRRAFDASIRYFVSKSNFKELSFS